MSRPMWTVALAALLTSATTLHGQTPLKATPPASSAAPAAASVPATPAGEVPLQCWWRASAGAVHVGEIVDVTLTCSALESDATRVVPDETRLTVAAVQMAPWEIVGGSHPADTRAGSRRLFQYDYQLRLLDANAIGRDVKLPALTIPYRLQSRMGADAALSGRDLTHVMPQIPIRVVGQVPGEASDIRDGATASLTEIAALRFRANAYRTGGTVLSVLAGVAVLAALAPLAGRVRKTRVRAPGRVSDRAVLTHAAARLEALAAGAAGGWSPEAVREAHATARLVAGAMLGDGVRQRRLAAGETVPDGRVLLERRFGRVRSALTASTTPGQIDDALAAQPVDAPPATRARFERLREALQTLARAQFTPAATPFDDTALTEAARAMRDLGRETARERLWAWRPWQRDPAPGALSLGS